MGVETAFSRGVRGGSRAKAAWIRERRADALDKIRQIEKAEQWLQAHPVSADRCRADYKMRAKCLELTHYADQLGKNIAVLTTMAAAEARG